MVPMPVFSIFRQKTIDNEILPRVGAGVSVLKTLSRRNTQELSGLGSLRVAVDNLGNYFWPGVFEAGPAGGAAHFKPEFLVL